MCTVLNLLGSATKIRKTPSKPWGRSPERSALGSGPDHLFSPAKKYTFIQKSTLYKNIYSVKYILLTM
jgi:hypothetical protein